jgi:NADH-quinone oxidoreductase subunit K
MMPLNHLMIFNAILFGIGLFGVLRPRTHLIALWLALELMLLAAVSNIVFVASHSGRQDGAFFVTILLASIAAETVVGLALLVRLSRDRGSIALSKIERLKG